MLIDSIKTVAVLGAGTMGNGIAHVFARSGYKVILRDVEQRFLDRAMETIGKNLDREVKKGKLVEAEKGSVLGRLQLATDMRAIAAADFVVEAVPERIEIKRAVLAEADGILRPEVIIASNTSSISMTTLAALTKRPDRFVGMHFMNPVPVMVLVEVIRALQTSDATFETTMKLAEKLEKKPVAVNDAPGFVSNRVLMPLINEALCDRRTCRSCPVAFHRRRDRSSICPCRTEPRRACLRGFPEGSALYSTRASRAA